MFLIFLDDRLFTHYHSSLSECLSHLVNAIYNVMKSKFFLEFGEHWEWGWYKRAYIAALQQAKFYPRRQAAAATAGTTTCTAVAAVHEPQYTRYCNGPHTHITHTHTDTPVRKAAKFWWHFSWHSPYSFDSPSPCPKPQFYWNWCCLCVPIC